ncbi:DUF975 family protein [Ligilactobacillus sp. LYQ112]|uniref:DUF975 family protein n=1 Tax=Ligilactobacillus sp. LYQ112 TaxID=3391060 RepID=UPI00398319B7
MTRADLKAAAKEKLRGNWGWGALVTLIFCVICTFLPVFRVRIVVSLIAAFLSLGLLSATYDLVNDKKTDNVFMATFSQIKGQRSGLIFSTWILSFIFQTLWTFLLVVPGIIKGIAYSQAIYIAQDAADDGKTMTATEAITLSRKVMDGHKWELFVLCLSFLGWEILSLFTLFIGFLWVIPYMQTTLAEYHKYVMDEYSKQQGQTSTDGQQTTSFNV